MIIDPGKSLECSSVFIETSSNLSCHILYYICGICYLFDLKVAWLSWWSSSAKSHESSACFYRLTILPITRCQIRVEPHEQVVEEVGENRGNFVLSPMVCQPVWRLFVCRSHIPTSGCQQVPTLVCRAKARLPLNISV